MQREINNLINELKIECRRLQERGSYSNVTLVSTFSEFAQKLLTLSKTRSYDTFLQVGCLYGKLLAIYKYEDEPTDIIDSAFSFAESCVKEKRQRGK
ncbi:hypothetical protein [Desulfurobacterium sp.]